MAAGDVHVSARFVENATSTNTTIAYSLRAFDVRGTASLGTLSSSFTGGTEFGTTASTRIISAGAITALQIDQIWRLVLDIGAHAAAPTVAGTYNGRAGTNAATDFALTSGLTTDLNPWCELSRNLNATVFQNYLGFASKGLSLTENPR